MKLRIGRAGVAGNAGRAGKQMESAKQQGNAEGCNIEWDARRDAVCTESARRFDDDERCALDEGSDEREQRSTGSRGLLLMSLASDGSRDGALSIAEARRCANNYGARHRGVGKGIHLGFGKRGESFGGGRREIVKRFVMIEHPARQGGFGALLNPLVDQSSNFAFQICCVIQSCELETLQGGTRSGSQIIQRWNQTRN